MSHPRRPRRVAPHSFHNGTSRGTGAVSNRGQDWSACHDSPEPGIPLSRYQDFVRSIASLQDAHHFLAIHYFLRCEFCTDSSSESSNKTLRERHWRRSFRPLASFDSVRSERLVTPTSVQCSAITGFASPNHLASFFFSFQRNRRASDIAARASSEIHPFGLRSPPIGRLPSREISRTASENELNFSSRIPFLSHEWSREKTTAQRFAIGGST